MPTKSIVTGASRGIGLAIARELAARGSDVVLISRGGCPEQAEAIAKEFGVKTFTFACDVSNSESVKDAFKQAIDALGGVDCLVNNAGITRDGLVLRMKDEDFDNVIATDLRSTFLCTRAVLRTMMGARKGSIVNIASLNGIRTQAGQANYAAAKAGVIGMTKSNSMEFGSRGITVNAVAPGPVLPPEGVHEPSGGMLLDRRPSPEDVAAAVLYLLEAESVTGVVLPVDSGQHLLNGGEGEDGGPIVDPVVV